MSDGGGAGAAARGWGRQLRAWPRHVRTTVAVELATALHYSAQPALPVVGEEEVHVMYDALRGQPRTRPEQLAEPLGPQGGAVTVGYVAAHDGLDDATVQFLLQQSLRARAAREEEAREVEAGT